MLALEVPQDGLTDLAERFYPTLAAFGRAALTANPLASIEAPSRGKVLWATDAHTLAGLAISRFTYEQRFPESRDNLAEVGISHTQQREGVWVIRDIAYEYKPGELQWPGKAREGRPGHAFAHFDVVSGWQVVRAKNDAPREEEWTHNWQEPTNHLEPEELAAINRVAQETAMITECAFVLGESMAAHEALLRLLNEKARDSRDDLTAVGMGLIVEPYTFMRFEYNATFRASGFSQLPYIARAIARAIAGRRQQDSTGIEAAATILAGTGGQVREQSAPSPASFCPPYEVSNTPISRPAVARLEIPISPYISYA